MEQALTDKAQKQEEEGEVVNSTFLFCYETKKVNQNGRKTKPINKDNIHTANR